MHMPLQLLHRVSPLLGKENNNLKLASPYLSPALSSQCPLKALQSGLHPHHCAETALSRPPKPPRPNQQSTLKPPIAAFDPTDHSASSLLLGSLPISLAAPSVFLTDSSLTSNTANAQESVLRPFIISIYTHCLCDLV